MKKLLYILIIVVNISFGQDVHFSQFNQAPLTINPALTGNGLGTHRVGLNYREQASFFTKGYVTSSIYYDGKYLKKRRGNDYFGLGFIILSDRAGDSRMGTTQVGVSVSYFKKLMEKHVFSIGFQGSFGQRSIDFSGLRWDSQYSNNAYNENIAPETMSGVESYSFPDVATGITWKFQKDRFMKTMLGVSLHHINPIKLQYSNVMNEILDRKFIIHGDLDYMLRNTVTTFKPSFLYERQGKVQEVVFGMLVKLQISESNRTSKMLENYICLGLYNRFNDSYIFTVVLSSKNTRVGLNYDINSSLLSKANNHKGAIEVSLTFHIPYEKRRKGNTLL